MPILLTLEDRIRHRFRNRKKGINTNWYSMDCRTAEKFLKKEGLDVRAPRPGYETIVKRERDVRTVLTNRGGKCEFTFHYGRLVGEILEGSRRKRGRKR